MTTETNPMRARIATNLAAVMQRRRLSPRRVAERSLLKVGRVEAILAGGSEPALDDVFLLAGALGVDPAVLLEGIEWVPDGRGGGDYRIRDRVN